MMPYWENEIQPICATARSSQSPPTATLRALVKHLDGISDDDIAGLNIPTGMPLVYANSARTSCPPARATSTPRPPPLLPPPSPTRARSSRYGSPVFPPGTGLANR